MVEWSGGYYGSPLKGYRGVTHIDNAQKFQYGGICDVWTLAHYFDEGGCGIRWILDGDQ